MASYGYNDLCYSSYVKSSVVLATTPLLATLFLAARIGLPCHQDLNLRIMLEVH
jgi:hypothetical protein